MDSFATEDRDKEAHAPIEGGTFHEEDTGPDSCDVFIAPSALAVKTNYEGDAVIDDDVAGFVITAWYDPFGDTFADRLIITNVGEDAEFPLPGEITDQSMIDYADNAWHWAEKNRGFGDFVIAKMVDDKDLWFAYDGTTADPESADGSYHNYINHSYPGWTDRQIKRVFVSEGNRSVAYLKFHCSEAGTHKALRVEWIPDGKERTTGSWHVSSFYRDSAWDYKEMEVCARFSYYDYVGGVEVTTNQSNLNVQAWPNGEIIGSLEKGAILTVYRCEEVADNGIPFTLISKSTEPDADGNSTVEYYGWVAGEYLTENPNWVWGYGA